MTTSTRNARTVPITSDLALRPPGATWDHEARDAIIGTASAAGVVAVVLFVGASLR